MNIQIRLILLTFPPVQTSLALASGLITEAFADNPLETRKVLSIVRLCSGKGKLKVVVSSFGFNKIGETSLFLFKPSLRSLHGLASLRQELVSIESDEPLRVLQSKIEISNLAVGFINLSRLVGTCPLCLRPSLFNASQNLSGPQWNGQAKLNSDRIATGILRRRRDIRDTDPA